MRAALVVALLSLASSALAQPEDCGSRTRFAPGELGDRAAWTERTSARWCVRHIGEEYRYALHATEYEAREGNRLGEHAVFGEALGDVELTIRARTLEDVSTNASADYALILGWQDASNHYLALFHPSATACGLYVVKAGARERLASCGSPIGMDERFHRASFRRTTGDGSAWLEMTFDGRLVAYASHSDPLGPGRVGVGSMNDAAMFDDPVIAPYPPVMIEPDAGGPTADASLEADAGVDAGEDPGLIEIDAAPIGIDAGSARSIVPSGCSVGRGAPLPSLAILAMLGLLWRRCT